jgi:hypothetical protein
MYGEECKQGYPKRERHRALRYDITMYTIFRAQRPLKRPRIKNVA